MKTDIHPTYYSEARVICSCGNSWTTGSTQKEIRTDVCFSCHPFYTGEQRIVDTAGQVDRFMKRLGRFGEHQTQATQRQEAQKSKAEQRFLKQQLVALDLSDRVYQILSESNFISVGDVATKLEEDKNALLDLDGFGPKALEEVEAKLTEARSTYFVEAA